MLRAAAPSEPGNARSDASNTAWPNSWASASARALPITTLFFEERNRARKAERGRVLARDLEEQVVGSRQHAVVGGRRRDDLGGDRRCLVGVDRELRRDLE